MTQLQVSVWADLEIVQEASRLGIDISKTFDNSLRREITIKREEIQIAEQSGGFGSSLTEPPETHVD